MLKKAFDRKKTELEARYEIFLDLQLKAVAHYGTMTEFFLGGFRKLYGEVVVEARSLLKNNVPERFYLLITDELATASVGNNFEGASNDGLQSTKLCEIYQGLGNICYTYTMFEKPLVLAI